MAAGEFHVGGHVPPDSPAYVEREFVTQCFNELARGRWVVLLGPRQHGKSSGLARLLKLLQGADVKSARLSLQGIPKPESYHHLLEWIARKIADQLGVELVVPEPARKGELDAWLAGALPDEDTPVAVLIDEAAGVHDDEMRSTLYLQLRSLHDERDTPLVRNLGRSFALLFSGTFEPDRLVGDSLTSPFNVCTSIEPQDLTLDDAHTLVRQLEAAQAAPFVERAFGLVGGQPLLLQQLLAAAESGDAVASAEERYEAAAHQLLIGNSDHVRSLITAVVSDAPVREIATRVVQDDGGAQFVSTPEHQMLVTLGIARIDGDRLVPRNSLYGQLSARHPLLSDDDASPPGVQIAPPGSGTFDFVNEPYLRSFAEQMVEGAYTAFNAGHLRLGLIGLGSALEAILIDVLEQVDPAARDAARHAANQKAPGQLLSNREAPNDPNSWRLVTLVRVADELPSLASSPMQAGHALRELRNFVHPALGRTAGLDESELQSEFEVAQGLLKVLLRELS